MTTSGAPDSSRSSRRYLTLSAIALSSFLIPFSGSSLNIALPHIARDLNINVISLNWLVTAYLLTSAALLLPIGRLADIVGRRGIFICGTIFYTLTSFLIIAANSEGLLIALRALQGAASAMVFATGVAILTASFPESERGRVQGINVATVYMGLSCGPFLGGILTHHFGWRSLFWVHALLGLGMIALAWRGLERARGEAHNEKYDFNGAFLYTGAYVVLMMGIEFLPGLGALPLIALGAAGAVGLAYVERRAAKPLINISLFRNNPVFAMSNLAALIHYCATFATGYLMSLYLQNVRGLDAQAAGLVLVSQPLIQAVLSPVAGFLSDRIEPRIVASLGMSLTAAGLFGFYFISATTPLSVIVVLLLIMGFGFALFSSPNINAVMSSVTPRFYGVASATLGTVRFTGQVFSMAIVTVIFHHLIGRVQIGPESAPGLLLSVRFASVFFGILCLTGIAASMARGRLLQKNATG